MLRYTLRRLVWMLPPMFIVSVATFFGLNALPGDIATLTLGENATPEAVEEFREKNGLDRPIVVRYVDWLGGMIRGDPGDSLKGGRPMSEDIKVRLPVTLHILFFSLFFTAFFGVLFGVAAALFQDTAIDYVIRTFAVFSDSFPNFFLLTLLLLIPAILWQYSPPIGYEGPIWEDPWRTVRQFVPPTLLLGLGAAFLTRITRSSMLEVLRADFVRTARTKGLSERVVIGRHVLRNALLPIVTVLGGVFANLLGGTIILERVMTLPGLGNYTFQAVQDRDFNIVQAMTLYSALTVMLVNLLVDLSYARIDPRIRYR